MSGDESSYEAWIGRERRVRARILQQSSQMRQGGLCRVCARCGEACLCHETACPNCGGGEIALRGVDPLALGGAGLIRCRLRYERLRAQDRS